MVNTPDSGASSPGEPAPHAEEALLPGPWSHRLVHVRGQRLHVAETGSPSDPLVLLLHGLVGGWLEWRLVMRELADAPLHVVAVSGRGYATSDRTPGGYTVMTSAADAAGIIRALGHSEALVVGQGTGALTAWTVAAMRPRLVRGLVVGAMAHPVALTRSRRRRPFSGPVRTTFAPLLRYATPLGAIGRRARSPERLSRDALSLAGPGFTDTPVGAESARLIERSLRAGARDPALQHIEFLGAPLSGRRRRWLSMLEDAGVPASRMFFGSEDPVCPPGFARDGAPGDVEILPGIGHYPTLEAPERVAAIIRDAAGV